MPRPLRTYDRPIGRKPGERSNRILRERRWWFARREWLSLLQLTAGLAFLTALVLLTHQSAFVRGMFLGAVGVFWIGLVWLGLLVGSGQLRNFWGRSGERATAEELGSRRHRRQGWSVVHGLVIKKHEIDHVAVGSGGVLAVETKWVAGERWSIEAGRLLCPIGDPIGQARRSAARVGELLRSSTGGKHSAEVIPVLMVWGPGSPETSPQNREIDGVHIFTGRTLDDLRSWMAEDRLDRTQAASIAAQLQDYADLQHRAARRSLTSKEPR